MFCGDVIGQQHHLVGEKLFGVGPFQVRLVDRGGAGDEVAGARAGVEDVHAGVAESLAELGFQDLLDTAHMKSTIGWGV